MPDLKKEISDMSSVEFAQYALRSHIAPIDIGSVKARLRYAARKLGWSHNRVRDAWYADPRIRMDADEIKKIEEVTGLRYGRQELRSVEQLIAQAETLLVGSDEDFHRPFLAALRAVARIADRSRT